MIKLIQKIKSYFDGLNKAKVLNQLIEDLTTEQWNQITTKALLEMQLNGEKSYDAIKKFIDNHVPSVEFSVELSKCYDGTAKNLLMYSKSLTPEQSKLLKVAKNRKLNTSIIPILETIEEYESSDHFNNPLSSIDYNTNLY